MAELTIPETVRTLDLLKALHDATSEVKSELVAKQEAAEELIESKQAFEDLHDQIKNAETLLFLLLKEKVYQRELAAAPEYIGALERLTEGLAPPAKKDSKESKQS